MREPDRFDRELGDLEVREYQAGPPVPPATVGFEFDVHYGFIAEVVTDAGKTMPANGSVVTTHSTAADGFKVKRDGPRLEIATKPFTVNAAGRAEWKKAAKAINDFAKELLQGCRGATPKAIAVAGISGQPRPFTHSKTSVAGMPLVKLPINRKFTNCSVWASPQATIAIPLSSVGALIARIKKSEGKGPGIAMTGHGTARMGVRSDAVYKAKAAVDKMWLETVNTRPKLKTSGGTEINRTTFTANLKGFLILLASYMWTGELSYHFAEPSPRDYEPFAKAYLPLNVKAPFSKIRTTLLTAAERDIFDEFFASSASRVRMFRLVKPTAAAADGGKLLFPTGRKELGKDSVHERQKAEFGSVPTWNDLLDHTLSPAHKGWGDRLMVPLSNPIDIASTKPRVAIEMRRFGFDTVDFGLWKDMMEKVIDMAEQLD